MQSTDGKKECRIFDIWYLMGGAMLPSLSCDRTGHLAARSSLNSLLSI